MNKKERLIGGVVLGMGLFLMAYFIQKVGANSMDHSGRSILEVAYKSLLPLSKGESGLNTEKGDQKHALIASLRSQYGQTISHPRVQLEAIQDILRFLKKSYPNDWAAHVREYLNEAFPDITQALYDRYVQLSGYLQWAEDNRAMLSSMPINQAKDLVWQKKKEFFGDDAPVIWEMELKSDAVRQLLTDIQNRNGITLQEKTTYYNQQLNEIYGNLTNAYKTVHQQELINQFLDIESVQSDLQSMTSEKRNEQLNHLRTDMGMDADALKRWNDLDSERDKRWSTGSAYMAARASLLASSEGDSAQGELDQLRKKFFGNDADTIKNEELSGLYRFNRKRTFGKN